MGAVPMTPEAYQQAKIEREMDERNRWAWLVFWLLPAAVLPGGMPLRCLRCTPWLPGSSWRLPARMAPADALGGAGHGFTSRGPHPSADWYLRVSACAVCRPLSDEELDAMLPGSSEGYKILAEPPG